MKQSILQSFDNKIAPVNAALKTLNNKVDTMQELNNLGFKKVEEDVTHLSNTVDNNHVMLSRDLQRTDDRVSSLVTNIRQVTGLKDPEEKVGNVENDNVEETDIIFLEAPETYKARINDQDRGKLDGYMTRREILFLIKNFHDERKVDYAWTELLIKCKDPITFLQVVFDDFTFDGRITAFTWTEPELIDDNTGK